MYRLRAGSCAGPGRQSCSLGHVPTTDGEAGILSTTPQYIVRDINAEPAARSLFQFAVVSQNLVTRCADKYQEWIMSSKKHAKLVETLLDRYGQTYAEEVGIQIEQNKPDALFELLCTAILLSARIPAGNAVRAATALIHAGLMTPEKMAKASWQERVDVLTSHGYKRYDERTATMLGDTAQMILESYDGDLARLRQEAGQDVEEEKKRIRQFKGIGEVGASIFLREVQGAWDEAYPLADEKVLKASENLGLPGDAHMLAELVSQKDFPRLVSALVRADLDNAYDDLRKASV